MKPRGDIDVDNRLRELLERLGHALNDSISNSGAVADAVADIKREGYDIYFLLQATIGFKRRNAQDGFESAAVSAAGKDFTEEDAEFLKSLKIKME